MFAILYTILAILFIAYSMISVLLLGAEYESEHTLFALVALILAKLHDRKGR